MTARRPIADILAELVERDLVAIFTAVAKKHDVLLGEVIGQLRRKGITDARQECYALLRDRGWSLRRIGELFGRDTATVCAGIKRHVGKACVATVVSIRKEVA